ncbi:MAG: hypothetical protein ACLT4D_14180 [Blautia faecis]
MVFYEMKKIFSKSSSKAALVFLGFALCLIIYFAMGEVSYVNPEGEGTKGIAAARRLEKEKKEEVEGNTDNRTASTSYP